MARRDYHYQYRCARDGCTETTFGVCSTRDEYHGRSRRQVEKPWRCLRHDGSTVVLAGATTIAEITTEPVRKETYGKFFGNAGFVYGPGFRVWAEDWPVGTRVRIRAEIVLAQHDQPPPGG